MTIIYQQFELEKREVSPDELITYGEFHSAVRSVPEIFKSMIPRTLTLQEILLSKYEEETYKISEDKIDDFVMFRYELNTIFHKTQFIGDYQSKHFMYGFEPLSKLGGY